MTEDRRALWDQRHADAQGVGEVPAVLLRNERLLPQAGSALDLACGRGAGALWLASRGLAVSAWDYSLVAIERLQAESVAQGLWITAKQRDVLTEPPEPASFDLILVSHFLERALCPAIAAALRPGGLLCYQTFGPLVPGAVGPSNAAFRLQANELLRLFPTLRVLDYHEPGERAAMDDPLRGLAMLVAQRDA